MLELTFKNAGRVGGEILDWKLRSIEADIQFNDYLPLWSSGPERELDSGQLIPHPGMLPDQALSQAVQRALRPPLVEYSRLEIGVTSWKRFPDMRGRDRPGFCHNYMLRWDEVITICGVAWTPGQLGVTLTVLLNSLAVEAQSSAGEIQG